MNTPESQGRNIGYYLALASRRRWFVIVPLCLAMIFGSILAIKLPKIYEASTLILVQPQRVPERMVQPVVNAGIESRISTISQQILSRSNLERIIEKFQLFSDSPSNSMLMEDKIASMRGRIKVGVSRNETRRDTDSFSITYMDTNPDAAMKVANGLASFFIDENIKIREGQAVGTNDFLEAELENSRKRLEVLEKKLKDYRQKFMGELPEQLDTNLRILEGLQSSLNEKEKSLQNARVSLVAIENEMSFRKSALSSVNASNAASGTASSEDLMTLPQLREKLAGLRESYTDEHPDVIRLKAKIEKRAASPSRKTHQGAEGDSQSVDVGTSADAVRQRTMISGTIRALEMEIASITKEIREYQRRVEVTPHREQEMLVLKRDYDNMTTSYNSLLNRRLEAEISVNMEKKQKGEQFQVLDSARLPQRPISPNLQKIFLITIAAGLGLGGGLIFLMDTLDTSVRRREDLEDKFGLAILATVPRIFDHRDVIRRRVRTVATLASIVFTLLLTAGFASLTFIGVESTLRIVGL